MKHMEPSASEFTVSSDRDAMNMRRVQRLVLATTSVSYVMIILDTSVVNVALGDIAESLALSRCRLANVFWWERSRFLRLDGFVLPKHKTGRQTTSRSSPAS